jgi:hypothetical protein
MTTHTAAATSSAAARHNMPARRCWAGISVGIGGAFLYTLTFDHRRVCHFARAPSVSLVVACCMRLAQHRAAAAATAARRAGCGAAAARGASCAAACCLHRTRTPHTLTPRRSSSVPRRAARRITRRSGARPRQQQRSCLLGGLCLRHLAPAPGRGRPSVPQRSGRAAPSHRFAWRGGGAARRRPDCRGAHFLACCCVLLTLLTWHARSWARRTAWWRSASRCGCRCVRRVRHDTLTR